jgi:hypothetical protein
MLGPFGTNACTDRPGVCIQGRCDVMGQNCNLGVDVWEPVCAMAPDDAVHTFPNHGQATCAWGGEPPDIVYPGRCECQMDCDCWDEYGCAACASNGQTYLCTYEEIECNGLEPLYPGACDPDCNYCSMLGRMPIPACGEHFFTYVDICYADCLGREVWHQGPCLYGEGATCATSEGAACPSNDLFCLVEDNTPGAPGRCIQVGSCLEPQHCNGQPIDTPPCAGHWECQEHSCVLVCD